MTHPVYHISDVALLCSESDGHPSLVLLGPTSKDVLCHTFTALLGQLWAHYSGAPDILHVFL